MTLQRKFFLLLFCLSPIWASQMSVAYVTNVGNNTVTVIDTSNNSLIANLNNGPFGITSPIDIAISSQYGIALIPNPSENTVTVINTNDYSFVALLDNSQGFNFSQPSCVCVDGDFAFVTNPATSTVTVIDITTTPPTLKTTLSGSPYNFAYPLGIASANGSVFVTNRNQYDVTIFDAAAPFAWEDTLEFIHYRFVLPTQITISPDSKVAYVTNFDTVTVFAVEPGYPTIGPPLQYFPQSGFNTIAFSPDSTTAYFTNGANINVINNANSTMSPFPTISPTPITGFQNALGVVFNSSLSSRLAYVIDEVNGSFVVHVIDTSARSISTTLQDPSYNFSSPLSIGVGDNDEVYVVNSTSLTVFEGSGTYDLIANPNGDTFNFNNPKGVAFTPDGEFTYVTNSGNKSVTVISNKTNPPTFVANLKESQFNFSNPLGLAATPDGEFVYVANQGNNTVTRINTSDLSGLNFGSSSFRGPVSIAITPDSQLAYMVNELGSTVSVLNINANPPVVLETLDAGFMFSDPAFVSIGNDQVFVVNKNNNGNISAISTPANQFLSSIPNGSQCVSMAITPDATLGFTANVEGTGSVSVFQTSNYAVTNLTSPNFQFDHPVNVAVTPDGMNAYVPNLNGNTVSIIEIPTYLPGAVLSAPEFSFKQPTAIAISKVTVIPPSPSPTPTPSFENSIYNVDRVEIIYETELQAARDLLKAAGL